MRMLVTGGNGQLGRSFAKLAGEYPGYEFVFSDLPDCDISSIADVEELVRSVRPDVIINCAAYTNVDRAEEEAVLAERINALGARNLAEVASAGDIKMVQISTDYVFDGRSDRPILEINAPAPVNVYGKTKLEGEKYVSRSGADSIIVRTSWLYSELGHNFVKAILAVAGQNDKVKVVDDQFGSPTYASDLARAVMALVCRGIIGSHIFHFCGRGIVSRFEFARAIVRFAGLGADVLPVATADFPALATRPLYTALSTVKIEAAGIFVPDWDHSLKICMKEMGWL